MRRQPQTTLMEFFPSGVFTRDWELVIRSMGIRYIAWQGEQYVFVHPASPRLALHDLVCVFFSLQKIHQRVPPGGIAALGSAGGAHRRRGGRARRQRRAVAESVTAPVLRPAARGRNTLPLRNLGAPAFKPTGAPYLIQTYDY